MEALNIIKELSSESVDFVKKSVDVTANWITKVLRKWDSHIRTNDRYLNYTYGPAKPLFLKAQGHYIFISWVLVFLLSFFILGPNLDSFHSYAIALLVLSYIGAIVIPLKLTKPERLFWYQVGILLVFSLAIWFVFSGDHIERDDKLYKHILFPLFGLILGGVLLSKFFAWWLLRIYKSTFSKYIKQVELFYSTQQYPMNVSWKAYIRSLLSTPFYHPLKLVFFPSIAILSIADRGWMDIVAWSILLLAFLYLAAASVHERLHYLTDMLNGIFFKGGQFVVSIIVVALAVGRAFDESHITTLIESSPGHVNLTILRYVFVAYVLFWFYEYWVNRNLLEQFVAMFSATISSNQSGRVEFDADSTKTRAAAKNRVLQVHGGSRLIVLGKHIDSTEKGSCWHTYNRTSLLDTIFSQLDISDSSVYNDYQRVQVIKQRMRVFFLILNIYLVIGIAGMIWHYAGLPQKAEVTTHAVTAQEKKQLFNLHTNLFLKNDHQPDESLIFVAASGGGTRAAIYAESVLRGLKDHELLDQVVLTSSVSGGSAAMAYFAAYRDELINGNNTRWEKFSKTMAMPFIQDVLEGMVDWRLVAGIEQEGEQGNHYQTGFRLGELLAESFEYRFEFVDHNNKDRNLIGYQNKFGTIFNTAIVAKYPRWDCATVSQNDKWKQCVCSTDKPLSIRENECADLRTSIGQGGRLVFTNLYDVEGFPNTGKPVNTDKYLTYEVVQDPTVPLSHAAALSANFPPVFPNAAVDINKNKRYWVTDGGASDNRGILSLLYALHDAIKKENIRCKTTKNSKAEKCKGARRHDLHIFVAEASATNLSFKRSSGISAAFGAPARFASQIMVELAREIEEMYADIKGKVSFHYLAMPLIFRSNGGLGTHWMLPTSVNFHQPLNVRLIGEIQEADSIKLTGEQALMLVDELHLKKQALTNNPDKERLWQWICRDQYSNHQQVWHNAITEINGNAKRLDHCATRQ